MQVVCCEHTNESSGFEKTTGLSGRASVLFSKTAAA